MTPNELKKIAEFDLVPLMNELGFVLAPNRFWFYRKRKWFTDIVSFGTTGGGECLSASLKVWVPEMNADYDSSSFPDGYHDKCAGITAGTWMGPGGVFIGSGSWLIENKDQVPSAYIEIIQMLKEEGLDWFSEVHDMDSLIDAIDEDIFNYEEIVDRIKAKHI